MAENQQSGLFYNKEVDRVLGSVHDDLLRAQQQARADQTALQSNQQVAIEAEKKATTDRDEAIAKALKDQLELEKKAAEKKAKEVSDLMGDIPTLASAQWGGQGEALRAGAIYLRENLDKGDNLIEALGVDKTEYLIDQLVEAAKNMHSSYVKSSDLGRKNNASYNNRQEGDSEFVDFNDETYYAVQDELNAKGQFNPYVNLKVGEWDFGNGLGISQWVTDQDQRNMSLMTANKKAGYPATVKLAWDLDGKSYLTQTSEGMLQTLDDVLESVPTETEDGRLRYHPWQLTAMNVAYDDYVVNGEGEPMTYDRYFNSGPAAAENRQAAYEGFKDAWMKIFNQEQEYKNRNRRGSSGGKNWEETIEAYGHKGRIHTDPGVLDLTARSLTGLQLDNPGPSDPRLPESIGLKGVMRLTKPIDMQTGDVGWDAFKNTGVIGEKARIQTAAVDNKGKLSVSFIADFPAEHAPSSEYDDIMRSAGVITEEDVEPGEKTMTTVFEVGSGDYFQLIKSIGANEVKGYTPSAARDIAIAMGDINSTDESDFYMGVLVLAKYTNTQFYDDVVKQIKENGVNVDELSRVIEANQ